MSLKQTQEFIELIEVLARELEEAKADGKVNWKDAHRLLPVVVAVRSAYKDADQILVEIKDISENPQITNLLLNQLLNASIKLINAALK